jgi:hypothetical protein
MTDYILIAVGVTTLIATVSISTYKIGKWVSKTTEEINQIKELFGYISQKIDSIDIDLNNHIKHYDMNLAEINRKLNNIGDNYGKEKEN